MSTIFKYVFILILLPQFADAVPELHTSFETDPIPMGIDTTDDAAVWVHPQNASKSLILGVSKNKERDGGMAGLAIYDLKGKQVQYIQHDRLNNVDLRQGFPMNGALIDIASGSNRDKKSMSIFSISTQTPPVTLLADIPVINYEGQLIDEEPYGTCMYHDQKNRKFYVFTAVKSGKIYQIEIIAKDGKLRGRFARLIDMRSSINSSLDNHATKITVNDVIYEEDLSKEELSSTLLKYLGRRFQVEGCVADDEHNVLYVGMEQLGVFKLNARPEIKTNVTPVSLVSRSKYLPAPPPFKSGEARMVNDIEGLALYKKNKTEGAIVVSVQGIHEFALIDRVTQKYIGSFKLSHTPTDPITETDGIALSSAYLGEDFPKGLLVVHDHINTDDQGNIQKANYKALDMRKLLKAFPQLQ